MLFLLGALVGAVLALAAVVLVLGVCACGIRFPW